jgi:hypothetical protein
MKFVKINLHHRKSPMAVLCQQLAEGMADVELLREPWIYRGQISGLTNSREQLFLLHPVVIQGPVFMSGTILMPYLWNSVPRKQ